MVILSSRGETVSVKKKKRKKKRKLKKFVKIILCFICIGIGMLGYYYFHTKKVEIKFLEKDKNVYLASDNKTVLLYSKKETENEEDTLEEAKEIPRGTKVIKKKNEFIYNNITYQRILFENNEYYVNGDNIVKNIKNVVLEKNIYTRSATSILEDLDTRKIVGLAKKGDNLEVVDYDKILKDGSINVYKIKINDITGYVYGKYMTNNKEEALKNYKEEIYNPIHEKVKNSYAGGEAIKLDFYPNEKPSFEKNKMPDAVYSLYLNAGVLKDVDSYIAFAKNTKINAFVVDIKDNEAPAFPAKTFESLSPTNLKYAMNSYDEYKNAITKLKENGFYVIGRITTFKDSYYIQDHPENAILNKNTGSPFLHNGSYWPSAYNRDVWYYTLSLAKEAAKEFGFNEINFDYVRFPDRMNSVMSSLDLKNIYDEDKTEAIQRFAQYVTDGLHDIEVYVSIDVFGESTNGTYTTAYGQYWPAISNVVDAISGMPYPDHFSANSYGISKPWNQPYALMKYWASYAMDRQKECPTPARVRTWIQAYDVMKYVDPNGINYDADAVEQEIRGLYASGATDGYITWLSNSSLSKYKRQEHAFQIDYRKEYLNAENNSE